ncbi:MAG: tRNA uridine-5-carboxymethylaminomethyl(34) synthesis GTPase MnmE [Bacteroidales bacterium]|nr:tRNA uridine-5-carboxymethylaminomethyl(34) synthesis GTPase MnmE [Bacteroidales bacterium]
MPILLQDNNTICALATPAGGAICVIRLSGHQAIPIADKVFSAKNGKPLADASGYTLHFGEIHDKEGQIIDEVMVSLYRGPYSYTGEDSVEISCHGSQFIVKEIMQVLIAAGCRQAKPGEYTQRAYLNGKMDLSQAEAVADLVAATNKATHRMALSQLKGHFSSELSRLRDQLLKMTSLLELELDFSDHEELEFADRSELLELAQTIDRKTTALVSSFETGNAIKQGIPVAIVGKTNVGKSTLLNQLLHEDKAIVSDIHGTTRDVIEDTTQIHGITFRFIDTAGIRQTQDTVERIGIDRAYKKMDEAAIVLWMIDQTPSAQEVEEIRQHTEGKKVILLQNKIDLHPTALIASFHLADFHPFAQLSISAKQQLGIDRLEETIYAAVNIPEITENDVIVTSARHYEALTNAHATLLRVIDALQASFSGDLIAEDLRICLEQLADITGGQITPQETLNNIFAHFCVGK